MFLTLGAALLFTALVLAFSINSFTNVTLREFSDADRPGDATIQVFLSEYNPAYVVAVERRARMRDELAARQGGPIGLVRVQEVVV